MHIATLVHLTDLHLFVDDQGVTRDVSSQRWARRLRRALATSSSQDRRHRLTKLLSAVPVLGKGVDSADETLWCTLMATLQQLVSDEPAPVAVVQTGDVEAFGSGWDGQSAYPGFAAVHALAQSVVSPRVRWFDIYGNHDTWFGAPPLAGVTAAQHRRNCLTSICGVPGLAGAWQSVWDPPMATADTAHTLQIIRINSVTTGTFPAALARGRVLRHPPPAQPTDADTRACLDDLRSIGPLPGPGCLRVAMIHHPPHNFGDGRFGRLVGSLSTGALSGRSELAQVLTEIGVRLVLAGHRHALDPGRSATEIRQSPLGPATLQFVADSPTLDAAEPSFALYRLYTDDVSGQLTVRRFLARYPGGIAARFQVDTECDVARGLPLL